MDASLKKITDTTGWLLSLLTAAFFFALGQWHFFCQQDALLGLYSIVFSLLILYWLSWRRGFAVPVTQAVVIAAAFLVYFLVIQKASLVYDVRSALKYFPLGAGLALIFVLHSPFKAASAPEPTFPPYARQAGRVFAWSLIMVISMTLIIVGAKKYLALYDYTNVINFFFVLRIHGILGDITSSAFKDWWRLWFPLLHLGLLLSSFWFILYRQARIGVWKSLLLIYLLGNLGGLSIEYLATSGLDQLALELKSIHYHFYTVAKTFPTFHSVWHMLGTYASQEIYHYLSFPGTHPPLNIVWNWILIRLTGDSPALIAFLIGAAAWTGVFPMFLIGREMYNREFGYYMAGFYIVLPNELIINMVALDGLTASFAAWMVAFTLMGTRRQNHRYMLGAGLAAAGFALAHYSMPILLPALLVLGVIGLRDLGKPAAGVWAWAKAAVLKVLLFLIGVAIPFFLLELTTHWKFDYLAMQRYVLNAVYSNTVGLHPWFVGSWLCWVNYFVFLGVPLAALFIVRWLDILKGAWRNDVLPWAGLCIMLVPFTLGIGRQEGERAWMLFNVFMIATAALALWNGTKPLRYHHPSEVARSEEMGGGWRSLFFVMLALSFLNAMVIEMLVVDHF